MIGRIRTGLGVAFSQRENRAPLLGSRRSLARSGGVPTTPRSSQLFRRGLHRNTATRLTLPNRVSDDFHHHEIGARHCFPRKVMFCDFAGPEKLQGVLLRETLPMPLVFHVISHDRPPAPSRISTHGGLSHRSRGRCVGNTSLLLVSPISNPGDEKKNQARHQECQAQDRDAVVHQMVDHCALRTAQSLRLARAPVGSRLVAARASFVALLRREPLRAWPVLPLSFSRAICRPSGLSCGL
jgi:hypothetical protein